MKTKVNVPSNLKVSDRKLANLNFATLMSPHEVTEATTEFSEYERKRLQGEWALCGDVSPTMFEKLVAEMPPHLPTRITAFNSPAGGVYAIFANQMLGHQHRFVMPLYDHFVNEFFESTQRQSFNFFFGNSGGDNGIIFGCPLNPKELLPVLAMSTVIDSEEGAGLIQEFPMVVNELLDPKRVPSLIAGVVVNEVNVSVVMPLRLIEKLADRLIEKYRT